MRSPDLLRHAWAVATKDLLVELRSRTAILSVAVFVVLVMMVFHFGRDPTAVSNIDLAPSVLWVTFTFAAILALNRAFQIELENQALDGLLLAPIDRSSIYLGKLIANLLFVAAIELLGVPLLALFFNVPVLPFLGPLVLVIALATIGFVAVGTLFSAMTVRTRFAELLLPVLLLPFMILPLSWAARATTLLLQGRPLSEIAGWLNMLAVYDLVFVALAILLFPATVNE
jgi:heme exporter protein B